jgi:tetratricopeptide (TPR) repeat protein
VTGLRYDPANAYLHVVLGQVHVADGDMPAAIAAYERAISGDPSLQAAWAGRAEALFEAGDSGEAIASLNRALDIAEDAALLFNRATAFQAAGLWADALADLNRAGELDPGDPDIDQQVERCRERLDQTLRQRASARP